MPRAIWTGSISFGLVNVPVKLFSATEDHSVSFHQLDPESGERIRYQRVTERSGKEVAYEDIVKGYELEDGTHVLITPEELEAVEPGRSRTIDIEDFIDLDAVDPVYFDKTYHLAPADKAAAKPYALLREAMREANRVAIARFVMRATQHLAAIRVATDDTGGEDVLVLETMHFGDEVRSPSDIREMKVLDDDVEISDRERAAAQSLVESLTAEWDPSTYADTYRQRVLELVARKAEGERIVTEEPEEPQATVTDLMAVLEASVAEARQKRTGAGPDRAASDGRAGGDGRARFEDMSKDELYEEAKRRDIEGRSNMTKEQLIDALAGQLAEAS